MITTPSKAPRLNEGRITSEDGSQVVYLMRLLIIPDEAENPTNSHKGQAEEFTHVWTRTQAVKFLRRARARGIKPSGGWPERRFANMVLRYTAEITMPNCLEMEGGEE